ncbi:MAG TPA: FGGY-family carbohydrate kinase [Candidatus Fimimorpha excrementavium]|nr:FGGY-family carbohydrate kinase [Candidatus Fimimorpha excrementavium]
MDTVTIREQIESGKTVLGIELGSTRIKAILIDEANEPVASGSFEWENRLEENIWTYHLDDVWKGLQESYRDLAEDVQNKYGVPLKKLGGIGFSAMMHGYMAFDREGELLVPFRTWRNTMTGQAAKELTLLFQYNIPQRWSIAHLYQAILNGEEHVKNVAFITTLAGYVHWKMTGKKVLGVGDASGMFPIDVEKKNYNERMIDQFDELIADRGYPWKLEEILPTVLLAGEDAGVLTEEGARLLDPSGLLKAGVPVCPPEGDAGTGMAATNSVAVRTGNVSAGTSVFAMVVLEKELKHVHEEIDMVTTPDGSLVGMVHCNNCTSDLNAWISLFQEYSEAMGIPADRNQIFSTLYTKALEGEPDCGGLLAYNYFSGEPITGLEEGRPLFVRKPDSHFNLANFMRVHLYTALGTLKMGMDILLKEEHVELERILGHGGLFKTKGVGQRIMAAAIDVPVQVMETAGEGGAWGIALLASYLMRKTDGESLSHYLEETVFIGQKPEEIRPDERDVEGFNQFIRQYKNGLAIEHMAVEKMA